MKQFIATTNFKIVSNEQLIKMAGENEIILYSGEDTWVCEEFMEQSPGLKLAYFYGEIRNAYSQISIPTGGVLRSLANNGGLRDLGYSGIAGFTGKEGKYIPDITTEKTDIYFKNILISFLC